jgi:hypothetical protein
MSGYLGDIRNSTETIRDVAYRLKVLSESFYITGNTIVSDKLFEFEQLLINAQDVIGKAVSREVTERLNQAEQSSFNMVSACLAMSTISKEQKCQK